MNEGKEIRTRKVIALQVVKALKVDGRSQRAIAQEARIVPHQLESILKGSRNYTIDSLTKVINVLDMDFILFKI